MTGSEEFQRQLAALTERVDALEARLRQTSPQQPALTAAPITPGSSHSRAPLEGASLESKIGSQLFNRVGIIAVLIAAAWFLKLAIDRGYLGPLARVVSGILVGVALIAGSERFRRRGYAAFSYSLKAIGGGVLFLSIWAAYALFDLLNLAFAGLAMVLVTAGLGALAWVQDSQLLLAYALTGGFLSPLLLSNGHNHEGSLFSYLLVMDAAALVLVARKPWPSLAPGLLLGTGAYALGWYLRWYSADQQGESLLFAAITFVLFAATPFGVRDSAESVQVWVPILTAAGGLLSAVLLFHGGKRAWIELALAAVYYGLARLHMPQFAQIPERAPQQLSTLHGVLGNGFLLTGMCFAIHQAWRTSNNLGGGMSFGEQISYSGWLMLLGAVLLGLGFWRASTPLRWQGLVLVSAAAAKVFVVDMARLTEGYRVLSFLGLGLVLLAISFVYQRDLLGLRR